MRQSRHLRAALAAALFVAAAGRSNGDSPVGANEPLSLVTFTPYGSQSDPGAPGQPPGYPVPQQARTQANYIEGAVPGGGPSGDRHLILVDRGRWLLYETWATPWNSPGP